MKSQSQNPYQNYYYSSQRTAQSQPPPGYPAPKPPRRRRRWLRRVVGLVCVVAIVLIGGHFALHRQPAPKPKPAQAKTATHVVTVPAVSEPSSSTLATMGNQINTILQQNSAIDFSVSITNLNNNQAQHFGDTAAFTAASVTKLITAAYFLNQVEAGQQTLTETINGSSAEYELQQMIVVSDDNAWDALNTQLGYAALQSYANNLGLASFQSVPNTVTSDDIASLLQKLYEGSLLNASDTNLLLSWMKQANYRTYIVPAVPSSDTIYHKIGLYEDFVNDAAIITNGQKSIVLVIFTNGNGTYDWTNRATLMQQITTAVLNTYL